MRCEALNGIIYIGDDIERLIRINEGVINLIPEAISKVQLPTDKSMFETEVYMGRVVGKSMCVEADEVGYNDPIYFAIRQGRDYPSRVSLTDEGFDSSIVTIVARPKYNSNQVYYYLTSAWIGNTAAKEPSKKFKNKADYDRSFNFWRAHALVYDSKTMGMAFKATWREVIGERSKRFRDED